MKKLAHAGLFTLLSLPVLLPLILLISGSMMGQDEVVRSLGPALGTGADAFATWPLIPRYPTLQPYVALLLDSPEYFQMFWNSACYALFSLAGQALVGAPAAWAFARYRFPLKRLLFAVYIALMLLPFQVTLVAEYLSLDRLNLIDTRFAIILPLAFSTFPVFIMERFFAGIPASVLEAARIDGAGEWRAFLQVGLPLGMPGVFSALVLSFPEAWGMMEQPMTLIKTPGLWPLSLYLPQITLESLGKALASSVVALMPALLLFLWGQRFLEQGIGVMGAKE
jgi:multiple sugar transport system permease protein